MENGGESNISINRAVFLVYSIPGTVKNVAKAHKLERILFYACRILAKCRLG